LLRLLLLLELREARYLVLTKLRHKHLLLRVKGLLLLLREVGRGTWLS
jgi:hypothetical protein